MTDAARVALFEELHAVHDRHVVQLAARYVGRDDATDVAQDVWLRVWRHLDSFRGEAQFSSWLYRVTRNAVYDRLRLARRRPHGHSETLDEHGWFPSPEPGPDARAYRVEQRAELSRRLDRLEPASQAVLMAYLSDLTDRESARVLGIHLGTFKSRAFRARAQVAA